MELGDDLAGIAVFDLFVFDLLVPVDREVVRVGGDLILGDTEALRSPRPVAFVGVAELPAGEGVGVEDQQHRTGNGRDRAGQIDPTPDLGEPERRVGAARAVARCDRVLHLLRPLVRLVQLVRLLRLVGQGPLARRGALQPPNRLARHATFLAFGAAVAEAGLPLGWETAPLVVCGKAAERNASLSWTCKKGELNTPATLLLWLIRLIGLLISVGLIAQGAPFWYSLLDGALGARKKVLAITDRGELSLDPGSPRPVT